MIGLMIKDGYTIVKQTRFFLLLTVAFAVVPSDFLFVYSVFYASMLSITALAYDEQAKWNKLAAMMPYSAGEIVGSKYLMGYVAVAAVAVLTILSKLILGVVTGQWIQAETMEVFFLIICIALIVQAINLPIMFKVGVQKGRMVFIILTVVVISMITTSFEEFGELMIQVDLQLLTIVMPIITVAFNFISFLISKMLYNGNKN